MVKSSLEELKLKSFYNLSTGAVYYSPHKGGKLGDKSPFLPKMSTK